MKIKAHSLLVLLITSFLFISCDVSEVAQQIADQTAKEEVAENDQEDGDLDESEYEEEITEFKICVPDIGEIDVPLEEQISLDENHSVLEVRSSACNGDYSMIINGEKLDEDFDFLVDEETTGEDLLEQLLDSEYEDDCSDHDDQESDLDEDQDDKTQE